MLLSIALLVVALMRPTFGLLMADTLHHATHTLQNLLPLITSALPLEVAVEKVPEIVEKTPNIIIVDINNLGALVPPVPSLPTIHVQETGSLFDKVEAIIKANPKLSGSTSAYVTDLVNNNALFSSLKYLYDPFTDARNALSDYFKANPDVSGVSTSAYLSTAKEQLAAAFRGGAGAGFENIIKSNPDLGRPTSTYLSEGFASNFKTAGKVVERFIDENPEYKQSTSALVMQYYDSVFVPKVTETGEFLEKSPLFTDTRNLAAMPFSEVFGIFAEKFNTASEPTLGPVRTGLGNFLSGWGGQINKAFAGVGGVSSTSDLFGKGYGSISEAVRTDFGLTPEQKAAGSTAAVAEAVFNNAASTFVPPNLDVDVSGAVESVTQIASAAPEALGRAGNTLGVQLAEKGDILRTNTLGGLKSTGDGLSQISEGIVNIGIPKVVEGSQQVVSGFKEAGVSTADGLSKLQSDLIAPKEITIDPRIVDKFSGIGNKISQWKFFTDDNHMENGFWEVNTKKFIDYSIESQERLKASTKDYIEAAKAAKQAADAVGK